MSIETDNTVKQRTIAEHMQVSVATVSKALRGQPDISPAMRERVEKAARELGYSLSRTRRRRRVEKHSVKGQFIGVFIRKPLDGSTKNAPTYLGGMSQLSSQLNVSLVVQEWKYADDPLTVLDKRLQPPAMREGALSGLALGGEWPVEAINQLSRRHQIVLFPQNVMGSNVDVIGLDNITVMLQIVERLKLLGHERIGFVGRCGSMAWASERFAGYVNAVDRLGLPYDPNWVIDIEEVPMLNVGYADYWRKKIDQLETKRKNDGVEAWVCSSDWPAFQVYRGMVDRGYRIPEELSITGFDDTEPVNLGCPPVTSVRLPTETIGEAVFKRLVYRINNPQSQVRESRFACEIVDHGTTGPPTYASDNGSGRLCPTGKEEASIKGT